MVEAIESLFVPVLISNNKKGYDEQILKQYDEPAWNNPVVRYLDKTGKDVIDRQDRMWTTGQTAVRMTMALEAAGKPVPEYLQLVAQENYGRFRKATFAMACYWEGEVKLGRIPGVVATDAGWIGSKEVVNVTFNPSIVKYEALLKTAKSMQCASTVFTHNEQQLAVAKRYVGEDAVEIPPANQQRPVRYSEQKYHLRRTALRYLPMTPIQLAKVNSALILRQDYARFLSPRQIELAKKIQQVAKDSPDKLEGLAAPDDAKDLVSYADKLEKRLQ